MTKHLPIIGLHVLVPGLCALAGAVAILLTGCGGGGSSPEQKMTGWLKTYSNGNWTIESCDTQKDEGGGDDVQCRVVNSVSGKHDTVRVIFDDGFDVPVSETR